MLIVNEAEVLRNHRSNQFSSRNVNMSLSYRKNKDKTRDIGTGDPARLHAQVAGWWGLIKCAMRKIIFCTERTRAAKARQKSCIVPARRVQRTKQGWIPLFSILFLSPHSPQFQQSAGATSLLYLWTEPAMSSVLTLKPSTLYPLEVSLGASATLLMSGYFVLSQ